RLVRQPSGAEKLKSGPRTTRVGTGWVFVPPPQAGRMNSRARGTQTLAGDRKEPQNMVKTKDKVSDAAGNVKPYVDRALHDEELRDNLRNAYASARTIYDELVGKRGVSGVATRIATDKDIQDELRSTIEGLRKAADRVQGNEPRKS